MQKFSKDWFELADHRRRLFSRAVWVPIYGTQQPLKESTYGLEGNAMAPSVSYCGHWLLIA